MTMIFRELYPEMELSLLNSDMSWAAEQDAAFLGKKHKKKTKLLDASRAVLPWMIGNLSCFIALDLQLQQHSNRVFGVT